MSYMDDSITLQLKKPNTQKGGGLWNAMKRGLANESIFHSYFIAGTKPSSVLVLSPSIPSDIVAIPISKGEKWNVSSGAFLAATKTIQISGKFAFKGILTGEDVMLTTAEAIDGDGIVWVAAYGHIEKQDLKEGHGLLVNNECFVACPENVSYTTGKAATSWFGSYFSKEGLVMKFPSGTVYTSTNGVYSFAKHLALLMPSNKNSGRGIPLDNVSKLFS